MPGQSSTCTARTAQPFGRPCLSLPFSTLAHAERASNRTVKPRQHNEKPLSAEMLFYGNDHSQINLLFIFFAPVFYLVHPEVRNSKFHEHAKPAVYYGPSRDTDSERYCLLWNGQRTFTCDIGCMRIDESQLLARMSKTSAALQPWTLEPDEEPPMPNFDQWTTPSLTNTTGGQNEPEIVMQVAQRGLGRVQAQLKWASRAHCARGRG